MNKLFKITISAIGGTAILIAFGLWYAASTVDPVQMTKLLSSSVKTATGRDLKITGPVSLSFFPRISLAAEGLSLSNASWASDSEMLTLKRIEVNIKTLPLLSKRVELASVKFTGLELLLQKNGVGQANWDFIVDASTSTSGNKNLSETSSVSDDLISLDSVSITDAYIQYQNSFNAISSYQIQRLSLADSGDKTIVALNMKLQDQTLELSGKTGSLSRLFKQWNVSSVQFPIDLNFTMSGKSMLIKGEVSKNHQTLPMINLTLNSNVFDWPVFSASPNHPPRDLNGAKPAPLTHQTQKPQSNYLFSNERIPFDVLTQAKGEIVMNIGELNLPKRKPIENLQASLQLNGSVIDIPNLRFEMGKGSADLQMKLSGLDTSIPVITAKGVTKDFMLEGLLARLDPGSKVSGGSMKMAFDVQTSGSSLHQMASNSNGKIQLSINQARMGTNFLNDAGDFVVTLLDSMNPLRKKTSETILECAVAYLPINNGLINIAKSVGAETDRLDVAITGSINLKTEAINLTIDPHEKSGLTTGLDLSGMVKIGGTLANPKAGINQAGVVNSAVSIGLGFLTGGASILAENARSMTSKSRPCRDALHPWSDIYPGAE
jgi:uncharacterized protein involved in outer membrane biogenesis